MEFDLLISGAGPAGLCLARALADTGLTIGLVEQQPEEALREAAFDGREIALTQRSASLMRELGLWKRIQDVDGAAFSPLRDARATQIMQLGLQDHALLLGEQSEVPALMEAADLVVLPSLREGLSNVVLEAMALGRAVLSTPVGGIPQAIDNGLHGVLVEPTDTDALARALLTLIDDPALRARLGHAAQHKVLEQYSPPAMVSAMLKEYSRVSQR